MNTDRTTRALQAFLAIAVTFGFFAVIAALFSPSGLATANKDILLVMLGALLASWKEVTGYFFGSSSGSAKKDERNDALSAQLAATAPAAVPPAVTINNDPSNPVNVSEVKP